MLNLRDTAGQVIVQGFLSPLATRSLPELNQYVSKLLKVKPSKIPLRDRTFVALIAIHPDMKENAAQCSARLILRKISPSLFLDVALCGYFTSDGGKLLRSAIKELVFNRSKEVNNTRVAALLSHCDRLRETYLAELRGVRQTKPLLDIWQNKDESTLPWVERMELIRRLARWTNAEWHEYDRGRPLKFYTSRDFTDEQLSQSAVCPEDIRLLHVLSKIVRLAPKTANRNGKKEETAGR